MNMQLFFVFVLSIDMIISYYFIYTYRFTPSNLGMVRREDTLQRGTSQTEEH